jgi:hypothetical protein
MAAISFPSHIEVVLSLYVVALIIFLRSLFFFQFKANGTLMQMVAADWLRSDKREDDLAGRPGSIVQVVF